MNSANFKKIIFQIFIIFIIFLLDRISKSYIIDIAKISGNVDIYINSFINLILVWNKGIGFGLLSSDNSIFYNLVTILIILVNILIIYLIFKSDDYRIYFFLFVLGGSLGNLYDRIYYSAVPDFIDLNIGGYHWFIFNVADIFITIGVLFLVLNELFNFKKKNAK